MCYIIYKTINQVNGKIYIGQHYTSANDNYLGSGLYIKRAMKKYGKENFIRETLEFCNSVNVDEREIFWIAHLSATNLDIGYNILNGGKGIIFGTLLSQKHRTNISKSKCGKNHHMFGKHHTKKTKQKMIQHHCDVSGKNNPMYGVKRYGNDSPRNKFYYNLSNGLDYWNDLSSHERRMICRKFGRMLVDKIYMSKGSLNGVCIQRILKKKENI
jgi:group I intron endonuclease